MTFLLAEIGHLLRQVQTILLNVEDGYCPYVLEKAL